MELTARRMSAVSSMMTGVLPAPTPTAGFPEEYAAFYHSRAAGCRIRSASFMTILVSSRDGISIHPMMPSGAPASTAASRTILAASMVHFFCTGMRADDDGVSGLQTEQCFKNGSGCGVGRGE